MSGQRFVLDAYAARSCPLKTLNAFTPDLTPPERETPPPPPFFHDAEAIENEVYGQLRAGVDSYVDLRVLHDAGSAAQEEAALRSMADGVHLIIAPLLPRDWEHHRSGRPSALLRVADGYVPVLLKFHRCLESCPVDAPPLVFSTLSEPLTRHTLAGRSFRWESRLKAALQVAHYWRLLEATGHAASMPVAGLIGTERLAVPGAESRRQHLVITWLDLTEPLAAPNPSSVDEPDAAPRVSTLERYDYEHAYRVRLATEAVTASTSEMLLTPVVHRECAYCAWQGYCASKLDDDDLSKRISKAPLDPHEVRTLRSLGVATVGDLAGVDLDSLIEVYLPRVSHRDGGEARLRLAHRRARLLVSGVELERTTSGPIDLPVHDLEVDLDIETSADDFAYLWGFLVDDRASGERYYRSFTSFSELDAATERALAAEAFAWLRGLVEGRDAAVYHYSDYEVIRVQRLSSQLAERGQEPLAAWAQGFTSEAFVDMFTLVKRHFFGANGLGLKVVASSAADFHWRDEEPGGLASQTWFDDAVHAETQAERDAARIRVLEYNEDDVLATWHLRRWLRSLE